MKEQTKTEEKKAPVNVYQKIQRVRVELVNLNLKQTGKNDYSKFTYFELGDFLPHLNKLMDEYGLMTRFVIQSKKGDNPEKAILEVFNSENPEEKVVFYSETAEVQIGKTKDGSGGATSIQNLGGKITYMRRYLLMSAFEIIESDIVDKQDQKEKAKPQIKPVPPIQVNKINKAATAEELLAVCKAIQKEIGADFAPALRIEYARRKKEIDAMPKAAPEPKKEEEVEVPDIPTEEEENVTG
jgi:hypothetical protein